MGCQRIILPLICCCSVLMVGCSTRVPKPEAEAPTMREAYQSAMLNNDHVSGHSGQSYRRRAPVTVPSLAGALQNDQLRREQVRENQDFPMLPNPQVMLYLSPHFQQGLPFHGNWTTFSLYATNHYALPGEVATGSTLETYQ